MDKKQQILHLYRVDELSLRDISRKLNVDRKTVTRLINAYEAHIKSNPESGIDEFLAITPKDSQEQSIVTASDRQLDSLTSVMTAKVKDFSTAKQIQTPNNIQWKRQNQQTKES